MTKIAPLIISATTLVNGTGRGKAATWKAIQTYTSGLIESREQELNFQTFIGQVEGLDDYPLESGLMPYDCRNNRLAKLGLDTDHFRAAVEIAKQKYGNDRIGVFVGTSTSGMTESEKAYRERNEKGELPKAYDMERTHDVASLLEYTQRSLGLSGVGFAISTACSSSAKVFAAAQRHIETGLCDSAIVGGVDSLCLTTLYGFHSLELVSDKPCRPWDKDRNGINIGEAAGFALIEKCQAQTPGLVLQGYGESSDAYHMSSPHPEGQGAVLAMSNALSSAGLEAGDIGYVNLHGTATPTNDRCEDRAMISVFGDAVPCSSTKAYTGHTLGAAGITEAVIAGLVLEHGILPGTLNLEDKDPELKSQVLKENQVKKIKHAMSNSFGFGGSNCSLILGWQ